METKEFYSREEHQIAKQATQALRDGYRVIWHNSYETFYGVGWIRWVKEQLQGLNVDIKCTQYDMMLDYPRVVEITPLNK